MSGFVYKVTVDGQTLIKKEIPGPETIDEFLYEINALNSLRYSDDVIKFYGLVIDDHDQVKGLLISYADGGALIDIIYDNCKDKNKGIPWSLKERWAQQIVHGLADVHECGYVQGDFTLSNIVIDEYDNAKIIDINRRGCPVGWEPPEATPLIESQHRISMYIGVKSDLYQLGMVLWAIAMEEDEPEREGRPLNLDADARVPDWYRQITGICLNPDPRKRLQASLLLQLFPQPEPVEPHITVDDGHEVHDLTVNEFHPDGHPRIRIDNLARKFWSPERSYSPGTHPSWHYAPRGRSPPSPMPSNYDDRSPGRFHSRSSWAANRAIRASYSDAGGDEVRLDEVAQQFTPNTSVDRGPLPADYAAVEEMEMKEDGPVPSAVTTAEAVEKAIQDSEEQANTFDAVAKEDAQATPTQETVDTAGDKDIKVGDNALQEVLGNTTASVAVLEALGEPTADDSQATPTQETTAIAVSEDIEEPGDVLQEISGNVTKLANAPEAPENPAEGDGVVLQGSDEILGQEPEVDEKETTPKIMAEVPAPTETPAIVDAVILDGSSAVAAPEDPTDQEQGATVESALSESVDGESTTATKDLKTSVEPISDPELPTDQNSEPAELVPEVVTEPSHEETSEHHVAAGDDEPALTVVEEVEESGAQPGLISSNANEHLGDEKGQVGTSERVDAEADKDEPSVQSFNENAPKTEPAVDDVGLIRGNEVTDTLPIATTDPIPTLGESVPSQLGETSAPSEAHVDIPAAPAKDDATPRISPGLPGDTIDEPDSLAGVGGDMEVDDSFIREKGLSEEDFQLVDRPPDTVPTMVITTDTTT